MAFYNELGKFKDKAACIDAAGNQITYSEVEQLQQEMGKVLKKRSLVFSFCSNTIGSVVGYLSFLADGVVPLLLKKDTEKGLRDNLIELYKPEYLYVPKSMQEEFPGCDCIWEKWDYCLMVNSGGKETKLYSELGLLLNTSGSTGSPKLARQSYTNIEENAMSIVEYLELDDTERPITTLPMNYTYGLSIINSHLLVGATILLTDATLMDRNFWNFFKTKEATSFGGVPYTYEILKKLRFFKMELPSLRTMTQAGGKLTPNLHEEFAQYAAEHGKHFVVMYGQTEATARMGYLPWEKAVEKKGSMGIAIPGGRLYLKDAEGNVITEPNVVGELIYEGKNVTLGYAVCPEDLKKGDERGGILETGDMARMDEDGFFFIVGRKKRFLKIFGNRVNLDEIERMVKEAFGQCEIACAGVDDKLYAFVTTKDAEDHEKIKRFLASKTGLSATAFVIEAIETIPKNEAGKILYRELEKYYAGI